MTYTPNSTKPGSQAPVTPGQANRPPNPATQPNMPKKEADKDEACGTKKDGECGTEKHDGAKKSVA